MDRFAKDPAGDYLLCNGLLPETAAAMAATDAMDQQTPRGIYVYYAIAATQSLRSSWM